MTSDINRDDYIGLDFKEAEALAVRQGWSPRPLREGEPITLEMNPERLNLQLDAHGRVFDVSAG